MAFLDDTRLAGDPGAIEVVKSVGRRELTHVIHDVDGTHSLIRNWQPVMSTVLHWAMTCGAGEDFDSPEALAALTRKVPTHRFEETDTFCVESAGLSALTQMEYAIRRAIEFGKAPRSLMKALSETDRRTNAAVARRIWNGEEHFEEVQEPAVLTEFVRERTPRLFRLYEAVLGGASRDRNLAAARVEPAKWRVSGSLEFITYLRSIGCINYFLTGAVIHTGGGMQEEIEALGYDVGPGRMVEALFGSTWDRRLPKDEAMAELCRTAGIDPVRLLVIGDGRTEIQAGVQMGAVTMSRLPPEAARPRALHRSLGTNYIVADYTDPRITRLIA